MNSKFFSVSFTIVALLFSMPSFSQNADHGVLDDDDDSGLTIRPVVEYDFDNEGEFTTGGGNAGTFQFENGFGLGVDIGLPVDISDNLSLEANLRYRSNELATVNYDSFVQNGTELTAERLKGLNTSITTDGDVKQFTAGVSARYDIDMDSDKIKPYVGAGVHFSYVELDGVSVSAGGHSASYSDDDTGFGLTVGAGVNVELTDNMDLNFGYTYRHEFEREFEGTSAGEASTLDVDSFASHAVMAGIVIRF